MFEKPDEFKFSLQHEQTYIYDHGINQVTDADHGKRKFDVILIKHSLKRTIHISDHGVDQCIKTYQTSPENVYNPQMNPTPIPSLRPRINPIDAVIAINRFGRIPEKVSLPKIVDCRRKAAIMKIHVMIFLFIVLFPFGIR